MSMSHRSNRAVTMQNVLCQRLFTRDNKDAPVTLSEKRGRPHLEKLQVMGKSYRRSNLMGKIMNAECFMWKALKIACYFI